MDGQLLYYDSNSIDDFLAFYILESRFLPIVNYKYDKKMAQLLNWDESNITIHRQNKLFNPTLWLSYARLFSQILYPQRHSLSFNFFGSILYPDPLRIVGTYQESDYLLTLSFDLPGTFDPETMEFKVLNFFTSVDLWTVQDSIRILHPVGTCSLLDDDEGIDCGDMVFFKNMNYKGKLFLGCDHRLNCLFLNLNSEPNLLNSIVLVSSLKITSLTNEKICQATSVILSIRQDITANDWPYFLIEERKLFPYLHQNFKEIVDRAQGSNPSPLFYQSPTFTSKRAKTRMKHLFDEIQYRPPLYSSSLRILNQPLDLSETSFSLKISSASYSQVYIPVTTYRSSLSAGYYTLDSVNPHTCRYTYYYWEPESPFLLFSDRCLVTTNKLSAYLLLRKQSPNYSEKDLDREKRYKLKRVESLIEEYLGMSLNSWLDLQRRDEVFLNNYSSYLRPLSLSEIPFENGGLDFLDSEIGRLGIELNFTTILFTYQAGCYGRLVSELLDLRVRVESFRNISEIKID